MGSAVGCRIVSMKCVISKHQRISIRLNALHCFVAVIVAMICVNFTYNGSWIPLFSECLALHLRTSETIQIDLCENDGGFCATVYFLDVYFRHSGEIGASVWSNTIFKCTVARKEVHGHIKLCVTQNLASILAEQMPLLIVGKTNAFFFLLEFSSSQLTNDNKK